MLRSALVALAATLALAPAAQAADPPSTYLSGRTFACWQTFAGYAPNGQLDHFTRAARGRIGRTWQIRPCRCRLRSSPD